MKEKPIKKKADVALIRNLGLSDKAAALYLACLELGEATIQQLSGVAEVKRTSVYYVINELIEAGALFETKRNKKVFYIPETPRNLLKAARNRLLDVEDAIDELEEKRHAIFKKPRVYFLYGPQGFKHVWDMIFASPSKEFRIITEGVNFLDFVKEKYILEDIIKKKRELGIKSKQLIVDSPYARSIVKKDLAENRQSKIVSDRHPLPFTEVISEDFVAFISPRWDNTLFVIENREFAKTRRSMFEITWEKL